MRVTETNEKIVVTIAVPKNNVDGFRCFKYNSQKMYKGDIMKNETCMNGRVQANINLSFNDLMEKKIITNNAVARPWRS